MKVNRGFLYADQLGTKIRPLRITATPSTHFSPVMKTLLYLTQTRGSDILRRVSAESDASLKSLLRIFLQSENGLRLLPTTFLSFLDNRTILLHYLARIT